MLLLATLPYSAMGTCIDLDETVNVVDGKAKGVAYSTLTCCEKDRDPTSNVQPFCPIYTLPTANGVNVQGTCKCHVPYATRVKEAKKVGCVAAWDGSEDGWDPSGQGA